ncbi:cytochrome P450 [Aurantimonas sp. 22II-16-19i]|uniref:cytochrome P450 n=1 Tax=Aurantimonas sp. 22II-16-19i TaxID=1317114 RepID=UPI0009F7A3F5|nr:cytochrome P450 [Aurantimonas sp. 22II-16-19i]ORE97489.1 cytochrome P450 [Aurantimonas sp. 22II-16-19i]
MSPTPAESDVPAAPEPPLWSVRDQAWIISDHATAAALLGDPQCEAIQPALALRRVASRLGRDFADLDAVLAGMPIFQAGPMHAGTRRVVRAFHARMKTRFPKARLDEEARRLTEGLRAGEIEAVSALADALPLAVFAESLALDAGTIRLLRETGRALRALWRPMPPLSLYAELDAACRTARLAIAGQDGFGDLRAEADVDPDYPLQDLVIFLVSPVDSIAGTIAGALELLATDPATQAFLRCQPSRLTGFVAEALRLQGPNRRLHRILNEARVFSGVSLPKGANLAIDLDRVHRDPSVYGDPERIVLDRRQKGSFGFGAGAHACQGTSMGMLQAVSLIEALLSAWQIAPAASPPRLTLDPNLRSYERLPLSVSPVHPEGHRK